MKVQGKFGVTLEDRYTSEISSEDTKQSVDRVLNMATITGKPVGHTGFGLMSKLCIGS